MLLIGACALAAGIAPASAQTLPPPADGAPAASGAPRAITRPAPDPALPLMMAYRAIGRAEQAGATGHFIDAARTHYRGALARYGRNDGTGASAEASLASDLARAATDERPRTAMPGPKDVPPPPSPRPRAAGGAMGGPGGAMGGPGGFPGEFRGNEPGPMMAGGGHGPGGFMARGHGFGGFGGGFGPRGFSATRLAEALKVETGPEARQLAQAAVDANASAQRAALAGNVEEAGRASRVAGDLMAAVDDLVRLNHPAPAQRVMRRPLG
ncbi:MAG TPA: hypothetical protein VHT53_13090 [Candidatus Elarobacter sp.]|nr:hypothetical protein [Candidatus Elarobacter sp.]